MKTIVVPVNFSKCAANAAHYAADMALAMQAGLHLVHVLQPLGYFYEDAENKANGLLKNLSADLNQRTKGQVSITTKIEVGEIQDKIQEYCDKVKPFVVLMGSPGDPYEAALSASNSIKAARGLSYPLLVVPKTVSFHAIRKIAIACENDIHAGIPVSIAFLKDLRDLFAARFTLINVVAEKDWDRHDKIESDLNRQKRVLEDLYPELHLIRSDEVESGILEYLSENTIDWLMIFPRKHGVLEFHKSQSKRIVIHCPVPVMSISEEGHG